MRSITCLLFTLLLCSLQAPLQAQEPTVSETTAIQERNSSIGEAFTAFDDRQMNAHHLILEADLENVKTYWEQYWKERYDVDFDREERKREMQILRAEAVMVPTLSDRRADLFAKIDSENKDRTHLYFAIALGYDIAAGPTQYSDIYENGRSVMRDFEPYFYQTYYDDQISDVRAELEDIRDDREDAEDRRGDRRDQIDHWQRDIERREKKIRKARAALADGRGDSEDAEERSKEIDEWQREIERLERKVRRARADAGDAEVTAEDKAVRIAELERQLRELESRRARWD